MEHTTTDGVRILARHEDYFVNATLMCDTAGKKFDDWYTLESTREVMRKVQHMEQVNSGGELPRLVDRRSGACWVHASIAVQLAAWLSPLLLVEVSEWITQMKNATTPSSPPHSPPPPPSIETVYCSTVPSADAMSSRIEKDQVFYIATTRTYAARKLFKYGGVQSTRDLKSRLSSYNTGRAEGDLMYYTKIVRCSRYKDIEARIGTLLNNFKDKQGGRKEMVMVDYSVLVELVELLCKHYDHEVEYLNRNIHRIIDRTLTAASVVPEPIELGEYIEITVKRYGNESSRHRIDVTGYPEEQAHARIEQFISRMHARPSMTLK